MSLTFDSEPLIAYFIGEPSVTPVVKLLREIYDEERTAYINLVNVSEIYYILHRIAPSQADEKIELLRSYGFQFIPVIDENIWKTAAKIKSEHPMSLADAYATATAITTGSILVVGRDKEFSSLDIDKIVLT